MERDCERGRGGGGGCDFVCMCVGVRVYARVAAGERKGK